MQAKIKTAKGLNLYKVTCINPSNDEVQVVECQAVNALLAMNVAENLQPHLVAVESRLISEQ